MATASPSFVTDVQRERQFFFIMAIAMAAVIVGGFSFNFAAGRSSFAVPLIIHVHAFVFFGWVVLYLLQTALVTTGSVALHRRMGWLALLWIPVMLVLGVAMTLHSIRTAGGPPFFDINEFLFGNILGVGAFAIVALGGIAMRQRTDWHRRLMCCAMLSLTGPGFGRLLPMPFLIPWAWWIASVGVPLIFGIVGIVRDKRRRGSVHPAWWWGIGALIGSQLLADAIAYSPVGYSITQSVIDGTPGAERDMRAFFPPMP